MDPEEELHSFAFSETVNGVEHNYRITLNEEKYGVEKDGVVIAEVAHGDSWEQITGQPLGKELTETICNQIESHLIKNESIRKLFKLAYS